MEKLINITGKALSGEWGLDDKEGIGIPVLRTTNFTNDGVIDFSNVVTRTITKKNIEEKFLRNGDIIIEKSGGSDNQPVGRVVFFESEENKYLFNNFTGLLRVKDTEKWFPKYVFYSLYANYQKGGTRRFENKTTGLHNLQTDAYVKDFEIKEIQYREQVDLCGIFDKLSNLIDKRKEQLSKLDKLVKARFFELFGGIHDSKMYPYKLVSDLTDVISGGTPSRDVNEYWEGGTIPWVKTTELQNNYVTEVEEYITEEGLNNSSAKIVPVGTVLIAMYGQGKTRGMTAYLGIEACTNQACACILPSDKINQTFLWQFFVLSYDNLRDRAKGGNQPNLNGNIIKNYPVLYPPIELQEQFAAFVKQTDKSKFEIKQSLEKLELLKKALMQKYFG